jgi:uncharacterized repeat protein (TIGR01451 family)
VLASSAQLVKVLSSADPARVGERVIFTITLTITGDTQVTGVTLTDTFENTYLRFVESNPGACTVTPRTPDPLHDQVTCPIGDVTPGTPGNPGSVSFVYLFTFEALAVTPTHTVNRVVARADLDGAGPAGPATIGPAEDVVTISGLPSALPRAGGGLIEALVPSGRVLLLTAVLAPALGAALDWRRRLRGRRL